MGPFAIVKGKVRFQAPLDLSQGLIILKINISTLDGAPQSPDENVVRGPPATVPTDANRIGLQGVDKGMAGELRPLISKAFFQWLTWIGWTPYPWPISLNVWVSRFSADRLGSPNSQNGCGLTDKPVNALVSVSLVRAPAHNPLIWL